MRHLVLDEREILSLIVRPVSFPLDQAPGIFAKLHIRLELTLSLRGVHR